MSSNFPLFNLESDKYTVILCYFYIRFCSQASERHGQVARSVRNVSVRCFCTAVVLGSIHHLIESYYYKKDEFEAEERRLAAEGGIEVE